MRRKPCSSIDLGLAGLGRGRALVWAGAPEGALNGQRNAKVSIPLNRRFGAGIAAGGKIWHKKIPHGGIFLCHGDARLGTRVAPQLPGAPRIRQESLRFPFPPEARKSPWIRDRQTSWRMHDQTRFDDGAPLASEQPKRGGEQPTPRPIETKPPPLCVFHSAQADRRRRGEAARQRADHSDPTRMTIARRPRRGVSRRNEAANARVPGVRRPLIRPHSTVKPNSSTLVPNHFS